MSERVVVGGCRCGAVRIRACGQPTDVIYCHCSDCRRSSGAPVSLFVGYRTEQVDNERGIPKIYESSPGVSRSFCGDCGTPLSYQDKRLPEEIYVPIGVFDAPEAFEPEMHDWVSQRLGWLDIRAMVCRVTRGAVSSDNTSRRSGGVAVGSSRIYAIISRRFWSEAKFSEE